MQEFFDQEQDQQFPVALQPGSRSCLRRTVSPFLFITKNLTRFGCVQWAIVARLQEGVCLGQGADAAAFVQQPHQRQQHKAIIFVDPALAALPIADRCPGIPADQAKPFTEQLAQVFLSKLSAALWVLSLAAVEAQ